MIPYNNTLKMLFSQSGDNTVTDLKAKTVSQPAAGADFKSVFDKTLDNITKRTDSNDISKKDVRTSQDKDIDSKPKYTSFKEVEAARNASSGQAQVKKTSGNTAAKEVKDEPKSDPADIKGYDEQVNILAQMLGMSPEQLVNLAKELGFSVEDLKDVKKLMVFMQKLADYLEMNDAQKEILIKLAQEVSKQVNPDSKVTVELPEDSGKNQEVEGVSQPHEENIDIKKLSDDIKAKIDALIQNGKSDSNSIASEVSKVIAAMKAQAQNRINVKTEEAPDIKAADASTANTVQVSEETPAVENDPEADRLKSREAAKAKEAGEDNTVENALKTANQADVKTAAVRPEAGNDQNMQQQLNAFADLKVGMANSQTAVDKQTFTMPQPARGSEIINQVVEQAKVVLGQDKSEMVIQLKPDHLGKLELKVVTEQGIVAAKFIAENQQVKEIIETNMQQLKDSLQKQGISIDGVSVQVGHDRKNEYQQPGSYESKNGRSANKLKYGGNETKISGVGVNSLDTLPERLAQYAYESNTINLTA